MSVPVITHAPFPPRIWIACKYMGSSCTLNIILGVGMKIDTKTYRLDSEMRELVTRYVVVDTERKRRIRLRTAVMEEWVRLCLGVIEVL